MQGTNSYIIEGGIEGKKRLSVLSGILHAHSKALIESDGSLEGKEFLDVGCGGGDISLIVAQMVGAQGHVTAIDFDEEIVRLAETDARQMRMDNISFFAKSAYDINEENRFDITYARFLLSHLTHPQTVLNNMVRALKPGGKLIIEDIDFSGHYAYPERWSFTTYVSLFTTAAQNNGHNPNIGLTLFQMLRITELEKIGFDVIQPSFNTGDGKWMAYLTMDRIKAAVVNQNLATQQQVNDILSDLKAFTEQQDSIISLPRIFRAWGYKKAGAVIA